MPSWIICRIPYLNTKFHSLHKVPIFGAISLVSFSTSNPKISIFDYLVNHHQFSFQCASKVSSLSSTNFINKPQNADSVLNFLKEIGFSKNHIEDVVQKLPRLLSANLEISIKPKIKVFQDLGFHSTDLADIVSTSPWLLNSSSDKLRQSISSLKNVLGPNADICRLLMSYGFGKILTHDSFMPNIEYMKSCGICSLKIATYVCCSPLTFIVNQEKLKGIVQRVEEMGVDRKSKMFLEAVRVMSCMSRENWEKKLKVFRDLGFSDQNILNTFRVYPGAFTVSKGKIEEVTQLLLSVEDFRISDIVCTPVVLSYSVEKRLKPRVRVFKALQSKNLLKKKPSLGPFFLMTPANFTNKYLIPYLDELGDMCMDSQES